MKRHEWTFVYTGKMLAEAAKSKFDFHSGRLEWWKSKQAEVMALIKKDGIDIDESLAAENLKAGKFSSNYHRGPVAQIRDDYLRDLTETTEKVSEHRAKVAEYSSWYQAMDAHQGHSYNLSHADWMFFFGK